MPLFIPDPETIGRMLPGGCPVCGATEFGYQEVLWQSLIDEWQLSKAEADYINVQQGPYCR
jgi:hypothetical protein